MHRRPRNSKRRLRIALLLVCFISVSYVVAATTATTTPVDALARANEQLLNEKYDDARPLLQLAKKDPHIAHWALLLEGRLLEQRGKAAEALMAYQAIPPTTAVAPEARLRGLAIGEQAGGGNEEDILDEVEHELPRIGRQDLRPLLMLARSKSLERRHRPEEALQLLQKLRREHPKSDAAKVARKAAAELLNQPLFMPGENPRIALEEARALLAEQQFLEALQQVQLAEMKLPPKSGAFFEAKLLEEEILRKLRRVEEADHLLLLISADGTPGTADTALLRIAKNAWNVNHHDRGLTFLDSLQERFPESQFIDESLYIEGRIHEEIDQLPEARDAYLSLKGRTKDALLRIRTIGRLAWLYLRSESFASAAEYFNQMRIQASEALPPTSPGDAIGATTRDIANEYYHALYWEAYALSRLSDAERAALTYSWMAPEKIGELLLNSYPLGYYNLLARQTLLRERQTPPLSVPTSESCATEADPQLVSLAQTLGNAGLRDFAQYEIDYHFGKKSPLKGVGQLSAEEVKLVVSRASLHRSFSHPSHSLGLVDALLRSDGFLPGTTSSLPCRTELLELGFPTPFREHFEAASRATKLPLSLLYGISRTESRFEPDVVSRAGAVGLMQLMPATAQREGIQPMEELSTPDVNVTLGARHINRLLREYEGNRIYAIAAYNAGSAAVNRWRTRFRTLEPYQWAEMIGYPETKDYVKKVMIASMFYESLLGAAEQ